MSKTPEVTETPGEVTTTPEPEVTETPVDEDNIQKFVRRMYKVCFDRDPDEAGFEGWCNGLKNGTENYRSIALGFLTGEEMTVRNLSDEEYVTEVYKALFDREPDEGGYNSWLNALMASNQLMIQSLNPKKQQKNYDQRIPADAW